MFLICFSDIINENLRKNLDDNVVFCQDCGEEVKIRSSNNTKTVRCEKCQKIADYRPVGKKIVTCIDCGKEFEVDARNMKKIRCNECQSEHRKEWDRKRKKANSV